MRTFKSQFNNALRKIDEKFEEIKSRVPKQVLAMTIGEVKLMKDFNELLIGEKMNNLDITVKETISKGDEGECFRFLVVWLSFSVSLICLVSHLPSSH